MLQDFKTFIARGNVLDLAVGVIVGAAFGKIITSLVNDVLMPPLGMILGKVDFTNLFVDLSRHGYHSLAEAKAAGAPVIAYGVFINSVFDFLIVAFCIFMVVRQANKMMQRVDAATKAKSAAVAVNTPAAPVVVTPTESLLTEIRDLLAQRQAVPPATHSSPDLQPQHN